MWYVLFSPHRGVERAICPEPCAGKLKKLLMHMWRWWTAKSYKVNKYFIHYMLHLDLMITLNDNIVKCFYFLF